MQNVVLYSRVLEKLLISLRLSKGRKMDPIYAEETLMKWHVIKAFTFILFSLALQRLFLPGKSKTIRELILEFVVG